MARKTSLKDAVINFTNDLIIHGATYASVILTKDSENLVYHSSTEKWDRLYHETGYSKDCHLIATTRTLLANRSNIVLFWDLINPTNETSLYLNELRKDENLCHGVSFCQKNSDGTTQIITLTGRSCDINFEHSVMKNKEEVLKEFLKLKTLYKMQ